MRHQHRLSLAILTLALSGSAPILDNPATDPQPRPGPWLKQHEGYLATAAKGGVDLLFLGDSITAGWDKTGAATWSRHYVPRKAANFGIGGDRTQHVLWRIDHGELDGIKPKVVVLMIGTNNLGQQTEDQIVEGVKTVVERIKSKLPDSKILLLGLTPRAVNRDPKQPTAAPDPRIPAINTQLAKFEDGTKLRYLDFGPKLLDENGQLVPTIEPDYLHLSRQGYQIWADAIEPTLWEMLQDGR